MDILVSSGVLTQQCYETFVKKLNFLDPTCLKLLLSKLLGYLIILGSVGVKLPQIIKMSRARSAEGLALSMFLLETIGYSISLAVGFVSKWPFSTYGENAFIMAQNYAIIALIFAYTGGFGITAISTFAGLGTFFGVLVSGLVPLEVLKMIQSFSIVIFTASRVPQIVSNFRSGSTGQLAFLTFLLNFAGSMARIFTTLQETKDTISLVGFALGAFLNAVLLLQILIYGGKPKKKED